MGAQIGHRLGDDFPGVGDIAHLNGVKAYGRGQAAVGVPQEPYLEAEHRLHHLPDAALSKAKLGSLFFFHLAASRAAFGGLDFGGIQKRMDSFGEKAVLGQNGHHPHEVDKDHGRELDIAFPFGDVGIECKEQVEDLKALEEVEELVKQSGLSDPVDLRDVFPLGEVLGNACLVFMGGCPGEAVYDVHGWEL